MVDDGVWRAQVQVKFRVGSGKIYKNLTINHLFSKDGWPPRTLGG